MRPPRVLAPPPPQLTNSVCCGKPHAASGPARASAIASRPARKAGRGPAVFGASTLQWAAIPTKTFKTMLIKALWNAAKTSTHSKRWYWAVHRAVRQGAQDCLHWCANGPSSGNYTTARGTSQHSVIAPVESASAELAPRWAACSSRPCLCSGEDDVPRPRLPTPLPRPSPSDRTSQRASNDRGGQYMHPVVQPATPPAPPSALVSTQRTLDGVQRGHV